MTLKPDDLVANVREAIQQARADIRVRRGGFDETIARAEAEVVRCRDELAATAGPETDAALDRWRHLAADVAPGAASVPWAGWPAELEPSEAGSSLYRIGSLTGQVPALVPLLDAGHLRIIDECTDTTDAVVDSLLVRIVATTRPGSVRISLYDPRRLGAGLGGFHALSRPGLLTVYGVDELKDLLGALDRDIRRIQRDVLGGGHSSL